MRSWLCLAFVVSLLAVGCGGGGEKKPSSDGATLCERLGGYDAIQAVVKDFVENGVAKDDRINKKFATTDIPHLEKMLSEQIGEACGCPGVKYTGKDMKAAHAGLGTSTGEWNALVEDLSKALDRAKVKPKDRDELLAKLAPLKDQIVEKP